MGLKGPTGPFFHLFKEFLFFTFPPVHSSLKKIEIWGGGEIPTSRLAVSLPTRPTGNKFLLKGGLIRINEDLISPVV